VTKEARFLAVGEAFDTFGAGDFDGADVVAKVDAVEEGELLFLAVFIDDGGF
jgi:hypothetical protein